MTAPCRTTARSRSASTLIIALGLTVVCVSLAFACIFVSRSAVDTGNHETLTRLARGAARAGTAHAMAVLMDSYARSPNTPTHYRQAWQTGFKAIDSYKAGWATEGSSDDKPNGAENSPFDANGNDVSVNQALTEIYTRWGRGEYSNRRWIHTAGMLRTYALGRYVEPGCFDTDLVRKPVSFHLKHPQAATASSPDPAVQAGESYTPNLDRALYLDSDFLPVADRDAARYRTRYAVSIEDLAGHLYLNFPGAYTKPTHSPLGPGASTPTAADDIGARETDVALAMDWQKQLTAILPGYDWALVYDMLGLTTTSGWAGGFNGMISTGAPLVKYVGGRPQEFTDYDHTVSPPPAGEPDGFLDAYAPPFYSLPSGTVLFNLYNAGRGPVVSFATYESSVAGDWFHQLPYEYTPFGRGTKKVDTPREWDEGYTTCPWRINLPSLNPQVAIQMAYALMPVEARTYWYNGRVTMDFAGFDAQGNATWNNEVDDTLSPGFQGEHAACRLRNSLGAAAPWASWHAANPYPGIAPAAPGTDWAVDLGKDINISDQFVKVMPFVGTEGLMMQPGAWSIVQKYEQFPGGHYVRLNAGNVQFSANFYNISPTSAYVYWQSYWFDINVATLHTLSTAMLVWNGETGASWKGAPTAGSPQWPIGQQLSTQPSPCLNPPGAPAAATALPAIDLDADGDGTAESPSLLDSVEKLDRLLITNMGEYWGDFSVGSRPTTPATGVYTDLVTTPPYNDNPAINTQIVLPRCLYAFKPSNNIKSLLSAGSITPANAREMELVLNDQRMSLFGASPQYPDFRGIDFDDDGVVWCSGYDQGHCPADPGTGKGRAIDPAQGDKRFSLSGYFVLQQSHFFRSFVRGEVFDEILQRPVAQTVLESVLAIDPDGSLYDVMGHPKPAWKPDPAQCSGLEDSQVLFQRYHELVNDSSMIQLER